MPPFHYNVPRLYTGSAPTNSNPHSRSNLPLQRRWSSCYEYDSSCNTHRNILLGIVVAVLFFTSVILCLVCMLRRKRRAQARQTAQHQRAFNRKQAEWNYDVTEPVYIPTGPHTHAEGRDAGLDAPPPAYTRIHQAVPMVR